MTHTITYHYAGAGEAISKAVAKTGGSEIRIDETIGIGASNAAVDCAFTQARLESVFIVADQDLTLETNSGSSPQETISLKANVPLAWQKTTGYFTIPFSGNVTGLFFTNASGVAASVQIRILTDPTA